MDVMPATRAWLAGGGVTYDNGVATTPLCCPSRASIFSGQYVHNHGVRDLDDSYVLDQRSTIQHTLERAGYRTGIAGKYLNFWDLCTDDPPSFDRFAIMVNGYDHAPFRVDHYTGKSYDATTGDPQGDIGNGVCEDGGDGHGELAPYSTTYVGQKAIEFLRDFERHDGDPWFLYVAPYAPHQGGAPEPKYRDAPVPPWQPSPAGDEADLSDKPPHVQDMSRPKHTTAARATGVRRQMLRRLMSADDVNASIRQALAALGEEENTLVLYLSDNGFLWGEHTLEDKREPYEPSVRVPFYAAWPAGPLEAGTHDPRIAANIDVAPTIYDAAGVEADYSVDGESLLSGEPRARILIEGFPGGPSARRDPLYAAFWSPGWLYRENDYADEGTDACYDDDPATACEPYADQPNHDEYYDMETDPFQLENQLAVRPPDAAIRLLSAELRAARACRGASCHALTRAKDDD
jgi:arylsulfatase A-like enzyme